MADDDAKQRDDAQKKEEVRLAAEKRLYEEAAAFRRKEEAEHKQFKYGCVGCLTLLVVMLIAVFLLS